MSLLCVFFIREVMGCSSLSPKLLSCIRGPFQGHGDSWCLSHPSSKWKPVSLLQLRRDAQALVWDSRPPCVFVMLRRHYSRRNAEIGESLNIWEILVKINKKISTRKACQLQHSVNTAVVTLEQPEYYHLSVDYQLEGFLEMILPSGLT